MHFNTLPEGNSLQSNYCKLTLNQPPYDDPNPKKTIPTEPPIQIQPTTTTTTPRPLLTRKNHPRGLNKQSNERRRRWTKRRNKKARIGRKANLFWKQLWGCWLKETVGCSLKMYQMLYIPLRGLGCAVASAYCHSRRGDNVQYICCCKNIFI